MDKKLKFQKRLEEAMAASDQARKKNRDFDTRLQTALKASKRVKQKAEKKININNCAYDGGYSHGNYTSFLNSLNPSSQCAMPPPDMGTCIANVGGGYELPPPIGELHYIEPKYNNTSEPEKPNIKYLEAVDKWEHMELSEFAHMSITKAGKGEDVVTITCHTYLKPNHRVFKFLENHNQFDVEMGVGGLFKKTPRVKKFKIMLNDFLGYDKEGDEAKNRYKNV